MSEGINGYKLIAGQHEPAMVYAIMEPGIKVIYLYRDNVLATYSSELLAKLSRKNSKNLGGEAGDLKALFNPSEFEKRCRSRASRHMLYSELLKRSRKDYFVIEYKELQSREKRAALLDFLGAAPDVELKAQSTKRNSSDIIGRFSNPDDVREHLEKIERL
ncbi:MAG: hypothetical protein AAF497_20975, partial [Planctomycetota bacterium]